MQFLRRFRSNKKSKYKDSGDVCINPFQGWYRPYIYDLSKPFDAGEQRWCLHEEEPLCLVECSLESFRAGALPEEACKRLGEILSFFEEYDKQVILRFAYDFDGNAIAKEPTELSLILTHMSQVAEVCNLYDTMILCYQGLFIGNWGEMHGSRYITDHALDSLYSCFRRSFGTQAILAVRRVEWLQRWGEKDTRLSLFDDGMFGSNDDLGTFRMERPEALMVLQDACKHLPVGGEVLSRGLAQNLFSEDEIRSTFRQMRLSYLNNQYDTKALAYLMENGILGDVKQYMGYRLLVQMVERRGDSLDITLSNVGWGDLVVPMEVKLVDEADAVLARWEISQLPAGKEVVLHSPSISGSVYFCGTMQNRYPVRFANEGEERFCIGESTHA
ncbi:MAG: DUF4874 domain-containing protein [Lachnospiraceae bacterium]|nr:DUF4874 domain-containing protein [Lachnospiraceae bacterium]